MSLRLLSYNIRFGGAERQQQLAAVINACESDVVILQEATRPDVVERLAEACGMKHWGAIRGHSLAFLSRQKISHHAWHQHRFAKRRYLELVLAESGTRIFGVHLSAIHSNVTERRRVLEITSLLKSIEQHREGFHVLTGDFNTLAPGEHLELRKLPPRLRAFIWLTGRNIRWMAIRLMLEGGYADAYRMFHQDEGYTFPVWDPHVRLDYLFVPARDARRVSRCQVIRDVPLVRDASDHFPLFSEISDG